MPEPQHNFNNQELLYQSAQDTYMQIDTKQQQSGVQQQNGGAAGDRVPHTAASSDTDIAKKRRLIQHQLFLMLHAHKCSESDPNREQSACPVSYCHTMKKVLQHMHTCSEGKQCQFRHCASSQVILAHWKKCLWEDCPVCMPKGTQVQRPSMGDLAEIFDANCSL